MSEQDPAKSQDENEDKVLLANLEGNSVSIDKELRGFLEQISSLPANSENCHEGHHGGL